MFFIIWLAVYALEFICFWNKSVWHTRKISFVLLAIFISLSGAGLTLQVSKSQAALLLVITAGRLFNVLRVMRSKSNESYLLRSTRRTHIWLIIYQLVATIILLWLGQLSVHNFLTVLLISQVLVAMIILLITCSNIIRSWVKLTEKNITDMDLPTITVAIPARNETDDLVECLHSVLSSDYPKLEVLVLDDNSQTDVNAIIKEFAHDGIRFIKGDKPDPRWLAKNQAYQQLLDESSGDYIVFCGVDVRFQPETLKKLTTTLLARHKHMVSLMPTRSKPDPTHSIIQPMRYWWELSLPRKLFNRPPTLSTCWIIQKSKLIKLGGFKAVAGSIVPESFFARELVKTNSYSFWLANKALPLDSVKSLRGQIRTTIRLRYPQLHKRPELVFLMTAFESIYLLLPFLLLLIGLFMGQGRVIILSALAAALLSINHGLLINTARSYNVVLDALIFPVAVLTEIFIGNYSMYKYEFSEVVWKDRDVSLQAMHVYKSLPKI